MYTILVVVQVLVAISLIGLILIQHGKGADAGAAFGSGASGTVFGARGAANFLTRMTATLATVFFAASLGLAYLINDRTGASSSSVIDVLGAPAVPAPASDPLVPGDDDAAPGIPVSEQGAGGPALTESGGAGIQTGVTVVPPESESAGADQEIPAVPEQ